MAGNSWDFSSGIITGYTGDGFLGIQVDEFGGEHAAASALPCFHPYGFASRPKDADSDGNGNWRGPHVLKFIGDSEAFTILLHDPRTQARIPTLSKGSSVQYGDWGGFAEFDEETNTWTLYIPDGNPAIKAHLIQVGKDANDKDMIGIIHSSGLAITMLEETMVIKNAAGDCYIQLDSSGIVLNGNVTVTGSMTVGGVAGLPVLVGAPPGVASTSLMAV
jgi:phage baseplate assembly protein gpV